jgi:hypothetical protein
MKDKDKQSTIQNNNCTFSYTFNNIGEAEALRSQLNRTFANGSILDLTENFETTLDKFIDNYMQQ